MTNNKVPAVRPAAAMYRRGDVIDPAVRSDCSDL